MTEELKPCPAGHNGVRAMSAPLWHCACLKCGWSSPLRRTREEAVAEWNTRAESANNTPVAWVDVKDTYDGPYEFHGKEYLPKGKHKLYVRAGAEEVERLCKAAQALIDRWHTPLWKDVASTAAVIQRLEAALRGCK